MSVQAALRAGRAAAERLMTDRCVIRRPTDEVHTDPDKYEVSRVYEVVYHGPSKMQTYEAHEATPEVAGGTYVVQRSTVHLPVGSYRTRPGDVVTITQARDHLLVGQSFRIVQEYPVKSHATSYRVFVDDNVGADVPPWEGDV